MPAHSKDRRFMEIAIAEMWKSKSEHINKRDPMVGAILADGKGKLVEGAHRGNFSEGDHAEFTVLERLSGHLDPAGYTLYTTLEPCTERRPPKEPCAERIAKKRLGRVVIGMLDPNPDIHMQGVDFLLAHGVKVDFFDKDLSAKVQEANKGYVDYWEQGRQIHPGSQAPAYEAERDPERPYRGPSLVETAPEPRAQLQDLDREMIENYLTRLGERRRYRFRSPELWKFFEASRFVVRSAGGQGHVPTVAGLVLFGKEPDRFLGDCKIKAACFTGAPEEGRSPENVAPGDGLEDITGPLPLMVERAEDFFKRHVATAPRVGEGFRTIEGEEYPTKVIREAVINALVHRDYRPGRHISFEIFRDRIVVASPGYPPEPLTLERIRSYDVESLRRNPHIANAAYQMRYMDERGTGISSMPGRLREYGLREPEFEYHLGFFRVTFYGRQWSPAHLLLKTEELARLNARQREILEVAKQAGITSEEVHARFGVTRETANQYFRKLIELGLIEKVGSGRATRYVFRAR